VSVGGWSPPAPRPPVRIGDAERDSAIAALGEHFAAGRLSSEELDERVDAALAARFDRDLEPLFADLPARADPRLTGAPRARPAALPLFALMPLLLVGLIAVAVLSGAPWLLWGFVWMFLLFGFGGRRFGPWHHQRR
jgi:hypothetical protein